MNLDKTQWAKYGIPEHRVSDCPKAFYNKYFYRLEVTAPGLFQIFNRFYKKYSLAEYQNFCKARLEEEKARLRRTSLNLEFHRVEPILQTVKDINRCYALLTAIKNLDHKKARVRVEGSKVRVFMSDPKDVHQLLNSTTNAGEFVTELMQPANLESAKLLSDGVIFVKTEPKHKYRVTVKAKRYSVAKKKQIADFIQNYPDDIAISYSMKCILNDNRERWVDGYFHVSDTKFLTFLAMVEPSFVSKINELKVIENK